MAWIRFATGVRRRRTPVSIYSNGERLSHSFCTAPQPGGLFHSMLSFKIKHFYFTIWISKGFKKIFSFYSQVNIDYLFRWKKFITIFSSFECTAMSHDRAITSSETGAWRHRRMQKELALNMETGVRRRRTQVANRIPAYHNCIVCLM